MPGRLEYAMEKWFRKVSAAREKWIKGVSAPETIEAYVRGVADFLGVSPESIRGSLPVKNYAAFQSAASQFADKFISGVRRAFELRKWARKYREAFSV